MLFHMAPSSTYQNSNRSIMYQDSVVIPRKAIIMIQESNQGSVIVACLIVCIMYRYLMCIVFVFMSCQISVSCPVILLCVKYQYHAMYQYW